MANTPIKIKRSLVTNVPVKLNIGEPAYSYSSNTLYIGTSDSNGSIAIAGFDSFERSKSAYLLSNAAFDHANSGFIQANASYIHVNSAFNHTNSAYQSQNSTGQYANAAFIRANNSLNANSGGTVESVVTFLSDIVVNGDVVNKFRTVRVEANVVTLNINVSSTSQPTLNAGIEVSRGAQPNVFILWNEVDNKWQFTNDGVAYDDLGGSSASSYANAAFLQANAAYNHANAGFITANAAFNTGNAAFIHANSAFIQSNAAFTVANAAFIHANSAFIQSNAAYNSVNAAFIHANSAYQSQNATGQYANAAFTVANGAFIHANSAYQSQNVSGQYANAAFIHANSAFIQTNASFAHANASFIRANNSVDANNGGTVTGNVVIAANLTTQNVYVRSFIDLNTAPSNPVRSEGRLFYDNYEKSIAFYGDSDETLQIGQCFIRVWNNSGSTIDRGKVVRIGSDVSANGFPGVVLAAADTAQNAEVIGFTITSVANNAYGYVLVSGEVHDIDTSLFTPGQELFLSTTPGEYVTSPLTPPNVPIAVGYILTSDVSSGSLLVNIHLMEGKNKANGAILFGRNGSIDQDPTKLYWDYVNNRLGIDTDNPQANLHVAGDGLFTGNLSILGNLEISNAQTITTEQLFIGGNTLILNANTVGSPTLNAAIIVNRGSSPNTYILWDETINEWLIYEGDGEPGHILISTKTANTWAVYDAFEPYEKETYPIGANLANTINEHAKAGFATANIAENLAIASFKHANSGFIHANSAFGHANSAYESQNATGQYANAAFIHANSAYQSQNSTGQYANAAFIHANSSFIQANASFVHANSAFDFANGVSIAANTPSHVANSAAIYANGAFVAANTSDEKALSAGSYANSAFAQSNVALTQANSAFIQANSAIVHAQSSFDAQNTTASYANSAFSAANTADEKAVTAGSYANSAFVVANSGFIQANAAFDHANAAYNAANNVAPQVQPAYDTANAAFIQANAAFIHVNSSFDKANAADMNATAAGSYANAAFIRANNSLNANLGGIVTANVEINANLVSDNIASRTYIQFGDGTKQYTANAGSGGGGADQYARDTANAAFIHANSAFDAANNASDPWVRGQANAAFIQANAAIVHAQSAYNHANSAYESQNTTGQYANASFTVANGAFIHANSAYQSQNSTGEYANAAFIRANNSVDANNGGTITGSLTITNNLFVGNLVVTGQTFSVNATTLVANDTVIILGAGNYISDLKDLGFAGHYNDGTNAHSGLIRDSVTKEWYLFKGYTPEVGTNNNIDIADASFVIDTLNANLHSTYVLTKGIDLLPRTNIIFDSVNAAFEVVNSSAIAANTPSHVANSASTYANGAFEQANAAVATDITQNNSIIAAFNHANAAFAQANTGGGGGADQYARDHANAAFNQANTDVTNISISTGTFGNANTISVVTVAANGRISSISNTNIGGNVNFFAIGVNTPPDSANAGSIRATGDVTAFYSDGRLKNVLGTISDPINKLMQLSGILYINNDVAESYGYKNKNIQVGVIAQEVQNVLPEAVSLAPFDTIEDKNGNQISRSGENYLTVKYEKIIPLLIESIKAQQIIIETLLKNKEE